MEYLLSSTLAVAQGTPEYSRAVGMLDANGLLMQAVYVATEASPAPSLKITLQESNDLQNWESGVQLLLTDVGYEVKQTTTGVASAHVRFKYEVDGGSAGDVAIVSSRLHGAEL